MVDGELAKAQRAFVNYLPPALLRSRYQLNRNASAEVAEFDQCHFTESATATDTSLGAFLAPDRDCNGILSMRIQNAGRDRKQVLGTEVVNVDTHLPTIDKAIRFCSEYLSVSTRASLIAAP